MSAKQEGTTAEHKTKKFGKSERSIPHHTQKAKKFYPAEDEAKQKKVREALFNPVLTVIYIQDARVVYLSLAHAKFL